MKQPIIFRIFKADKLVEVKQLDVDQIVIGRGGEAQVSLDDEGVSPIHCLVELRDSGYYICDLGSQSGTFKNGQQILDEPLSSGDELQIGPFKIAFFVGVPKPQVAPPPVAEKTPPSPPPPKGKNKNYDIPTTKPNLVVADTAPIPINKITKPTLTKPTSASGRKTLINVDGKTFAPPSAIKDLKEAIKPSKGNVLEVLVAWKERVIETHHFDSTGDVTMGFKEKNDIVLPRSVATASYKLITISGSVVVHAFPDMSVELYNQNHVLGFTELQARQRMLRSGDTYDIRLEQGEVLKLSWAGEAIAIYIRFVQESTKPALAPFLDFTATELTGMVVAFVFMGLMALYATIYAPVEEQKKEDEVEHIAKFVYTVKATPTPVATPKPTPEPTPPPVAKATPPPPPKKVEVTDQKKEPSKVSKKPEQKPAEQKVVKNDQAKPTKADSKQSAASDLRPKPSKVNRPKSFTSTKQGGAVKLGETAGANAQSQKDVSKVGLFAAFGGGGVRSQLDKAYSGSGEVLGMGEKATGTSGQNEGRSGDDIGSKFKDTGAGGKGTATQGIAGLGTKGRGSGLTGYGSGTGLGEKGSVSVEASGSEAAFDGSIDREAVRRVVRAGIREIRSCYERELNKNPGLEGKIVIEWEIHDQGRALKAHTVSSTMNNSAVESCIAARIMSWTFPAVPAGLIATVKYPFAFSKQN